MTSSSGTPSLVAIALTCSGLQIALLERLQLALHPPQVEEQLLLRRGGAHFDEAPRAQDVFLDRRADPPHGVGRQAEALVGLEALDRLHQADVAFGDDLADRQAVAAIAHGDAGDEPQMRRDELLAPRRRRDAPASAWPACTPRSAPASGTGEFPRDSGRGQQNRPPAWEATWLPSSTLPLSDPRRRDHASISVYYSL